MPGSEQTWRYLDDDDDDDDDDDELLDELQRRETTRTYGVKNSENA